jgi:hypothetical protein
MSKLIAPPKNKDVLVLCRIEHFIHKNPACIANCDTHIEYFYVFFFIITNFYVS